MMYGTRKIQSGGNDLNVNLNNETENSIAHIKIRKQNKQMGRNKAHKATAAVCQRRCGGICRGANLPLACYESMLHGILLPILVT